MHGIRTERSKITTQVHFYNLKYCFEQICPSSMYDALIVFRSEIQSKYFPDFHHILEENTIYTPDYGWCGTNGGFTNSLIYYGTYNTIRKMSECFDNLKKYADIDNIRFAMEDCYAYHALQCNINIKKINYEFKLNHNRVNIRDFFEKHSYITSTTLKKYSDFYLDPFAYNNDIEFIQTLHNFDFSGRIVYINGDFIDHVIWKLMQCDDMILIIHGTDRTIDDLTIMSILPCARKIYAVNCTVSHPSVFKIPLGFPDVNVRKLPHHNKRPFDLQDYEIHTEKTGLCYMNFNLYNTDEVKFQIVKHTRTYCRQVFEKCSWIDKDEEKIEYKQFMEKLSKYKFALCPVGFGIDTHRFYECVAVGTRPIILSSPLNEMYSVFNPLIVNNWSEVTKEFLESQPEYIPNYEALKLKYWITDE